MENESAQLPVAYFPYTFLEETDLKRLVLYCSSIQLLQVSPGQDPGLPAVVRTVPVVEPYCPLADSPLVETVDRAYAAYRQLGSAHKEGGMLQSLRAQIIQENVEKSRTALVSYLRKGDSLLPREDIDLVDDAVFLMLAHEFDQDHLALDLRLHHILGLESKFREAVGIEADDEAGSLPFEPSFPAEPDHPRSQYALQRLRAWTRLHRSQNHSWSSVLICTSSEVLEVICDRLPSQLERFSPDTRTLWPTRHFLCLLPDPGSLPLAAVLSLRDSLARQGLLHSWWGCLAGVIEQVKEELPTEDRLRELQAKLAEAAGVFGQYWPAPEGPSGSVRLEMLCYPHLASRDAITVAVGLQTPGSRLPHTERTHGVSLHLFHSEPPQDDRP
jgi:hypothetical protein